MLADAGRRLQADPQRSGVDLPATGFLHEATGGMPAVRLLHQASDHETPDHEATGGMPAVRLLHQASDYETPDHEATGGMPAVRLLHLTQFRCTRQPQQVRRLQQRRRGRRVQR